MSTTKIHAAVGENLKVKVISYLEQLSPQQKNFSTENFWK